MLISVVVAVSLAGLLAGSSLNIVIDCLAVRAPLRHWQMWCTHCPAKIAPHRSMAALTVLLVGGRCRQCQQPISLRYPVVALLTAIGIVAATWWALTLPYVPLLPALIYFVLIAVILSVIDIKQHRLPNIIVLPSYGVMAVGVIFAAAITRDWNNLLWAGLGSIILFGAYFLLAFLYPAGMGWGDVKLAAVLGMLLGYCGSTALLVGSIAAFFLGALIALVLIAFGKGTGKTALPFGPLMFLGAAIGIAVADPVNNQYLRMVGL